MGIFKGLKRKKEFYLENVLKQNRKYPRTFVIPSKKQINELTEGMLIKLIFVFNELKDNGCNAERMWVKITNIKNDSFTGILDNEPYYLSSIKCGDEIHFKSENIATIYSEKALIDEDMFAIITKKALEYRQINWVIKDNYLCDEKDSGWQLFYGDETEDYLDNSDNAVIISLKDVLEFEPLLEDAFKGFGNAFEYSEEENCFIEVSD